MIVSWPLPSNPGEYDHSHSKTKQYVGPVNMEYPLAPLRLLEACYGVEATQEQVRRIKGLASLHHGAYPLCDRAVAAQHTHTSLISLAHSHLARVLITCEFLPRVSIILLPRLMDGVVGDPVRTTNSNVLECRS